MTDPGMDREQFAGKIEWEGGITAALDYGLTHEDIVKEDTELIEAWKKLEEAYAVVEEAMIPVQELLADHMDSW